MYVISCYNVLLAGRALCVCFTVVTSGLTQTSTNKGVYAFKREEDLGIGTLRGGDSRRARKGRRRDEMAMELENIVANTVLVKAREGRTPCSL